MVRCAELVGMSSQLVGSTIRLGREGKRVYWSLLVLVTADVVKVNSEGKVEKCLSNLTDEVVFRRCSSRG